MSKPEPGGDARLIAYEVEPGRVELRPASNKRPWMDATPSSYAYRCLPLTIANAHGWEMLCPVGFAVVWNGGPSPADLTVRIDAPEGSAPRRPGLLGDLVRAVTDPGAERGPPASFVESHFGSGILTFNPLLILRTDPGTNLWISGPPNHIKDGVQALSAVVESDWTPFTFSMNWKLTRPGLEVRFDAGEPFCFFFPVRRGDVERCDPRLEPLAADPALQASYTRTKLRRNMASAFGADDKSRFQGWYMRGVHPDSGENAAPEHQSALSVRPFSSERGRRHTPR